MIKIYSNGDDFYNENMEFLHDKNYEEAFFKLDSPLLKKTSREEFAIRITNKDNTLLALRVKPYSLMICGDLKLTDTLARFLMSSSYYIDNILGEYSLSNAMVESFAKYGVVYDLDLSMDFMECDGTKIPSSNSVEVPNNNDVDEVFKMMQSFVVDCGLHDEVEKRHVEEHILEYRIIREKNEIASIAKICMSTDKDIRISDVYTKPQFRGKGYCRQIIANIVNETIRSGKVVTLNVDRKNPISNHVYQSVGFKRVFSQNLFTLKGI